MEKEKKTRRLKRSAKPLILVACAAVVGLSAFADWKYAGSMSENTGGYIYNSSVSGDKAKILGEATYVGGTSQNVESSSEIENDGYFAAMAQERQKSRDESLGILQTIIDSSEVMPDEKGRALSDMSAIASAMQSESNIETLVKGKGFSDCIAVVGEDSANVIVKTTGLLTYEVAQIKEIVMNELGISPEKIKIIEKTE